MIINDHNENNYNKFGQNHSMGKKAISSEIFWHRYQLSGQNLDYFQPSNEHVWLILA
jgi:hypothetical protein